MDGKIDGGQDTPVALVDNVHVAADEFDLKGDEEDAAGRNVASSSARSTVSALGATDSVLKQAGAGGRRAPGSRKSLAALTILVVPSSARSGSRARVRRLPSDRRRAARAAFAFMSDG